MNDVLTEEEISDMLAEFANDSIQEDTKEEQKPIKMPPFNITLDFKYKNKLKQIDIAEIKSLFTFTISNFRNKILEIKRNSRILIPALQQEIINATELENYLKFQTKDYKNENYEVFIKEYTIGGEKVFISIPVPIINLFLGRIKNRKADKVSEYTCKLYFFDLIKSYFNQQLPDSYPKLEEEKTTKLDDRETSYLVLDCQSEWNEKKNEKIPFRIALSWKACYKILNKKQNEITIHSIDYYKKQGGLIVVSGNYFLEEEINSFFKGKQLEFKKQENNICDFIANNTLFAKGIVGAYNHNNLYSKFEITEFIEHQETNYLTGKNNTFIIFASTNIENAKQQIKKYIPESQIQLNLDTEINTKDLLLINNRKIIATAEVTENENMLNATLKRKITPEIPVL